MFDIPLPQPPAAALVSLGDQRYGFCFVDVGISAEDLWDFDAIAVCKNHQLNVFGELAALEGNVAAFLKEIGPNEPAHVVRVAKRIDAIAREIIEASGKETAWFCLRAALPTDFFDIPRWHLDGYYYRPSDNAMQYKFAIALKGAPTLFYPLSNEFKELRAVIRQNMINRKFTHELFRAEEIVSAPKGTGVFFIAGDNNRAAFHSEPPIHENRLFFFLVPCASEEIERLRAYIEPYIKNREH